MERLPDSIHWKRWGSAEDWRVSRRPAISFISTNHPVPIGIQFVVSLLKNEHSRGMLNENAYGETIAKQYLIWGNIEV